jgi:drug/metabolite transporter (DMT)-like permease
MWSKASCVFFGFVFLNSFFCLVLFKVLDRLPAKELWGHQYGSIWSFLAVVTLVLLPFLYLANYFAFILYTSGYQWVGDSFKIWPVQIIVRSTSPLAFIAMAYLYRGELPTNGSLVGLFLGILGAIIAVLWK